MKLSLVRKYFVVFALVGGLSNSHAATSCAALLSTVSIGDTGDVYVALSGQSLVHSICNTVVQGSYYVRPEICKSMYALLLGARLGERTVKLYYRDPLTSCSAISTWSGQPSFYFVELQ
jgi:hypothetical protein